MYEQKEFLCKVVWGAKIYLERIGEWRIVDKVEGAGQVCTYMTRGSAKEGDNVE